MDSSLQDGQDIAAEAARRLQRLKLEVQVNVQSGLLQEALSCVHTALSRCRPHDQQRWVAAVDRSFAQNVQDMLYGLILDKLCHQMQQ